MLRWLTDASLADSIAGDLEEQRRRRGRLWFWRSSVAVMIYFLTRRVRDGVRALLRGFRPGSFGEWRQSLRALRRTPWYSVTVIAVMALSVALATTVFAIVDGVLFKRLPYADPDALYDVAGGFSALPSPPFASSASVADVQAWTDAVPELRVTTAGIGTAVTISDNDYLRAALVDSSFFDVLGVRPVLGGFTEADFESPSKVRAAVITYETWQSRFGGAYEVLGRTFVDAAGEGARIVGVLPRGFAYPHPAGRVAPEALLPLGTPALRRASDPAARWLQVIARLPRGSRPAQIEERLTLAAGRVARRFPVPPNDDSMSAIRRITRGPFDVVNVRPLRGVIVAPTRVFAAASFVVAAGLLLLGALNLAGLSAGRALDRQRELTLRVALGGGRLRLLRLLVAEYALIVMAGTVIGVGLAALLLRNAVALLPAGILLLKAPAIDLRVVTFGIAAAVSALALVTMWSASSVQTHRLRPALTAAAGATPRTRSPRRILTTGAQVAIALVMALAGTLLAASLARVWQEDTGFVVDRTARIRINSPSAFPLDVQNALLSALSRLPGVHAVGGLDEPFLERMSNGSAFETPAGAIATGDVEEMSVTSGFFAAAGLSALVGRLPTAEEFDRGRRVIVVSRQVAEAYWPGRAALGQPLVKNGETFEVIGVVPDIRHASLDRDSAGEIYSSNALQRRPDLMNLLVRFTDHDAATLPRAARDLAARFPNVKIVRAEMLSTALGSSVQLRRFQAWLFATFGGAALVIVGVGLLGTQAMSVARRTREVGIRMALGATRRGVTGLMLREQVPAIVGGVAAGGVLSAWLAGFLTEYLFKMTAYDWTAWTIAVLLVVLVTTVASLAPACRASRLDPIQALRVD
jgi:predicted permease